MKKAIIKFFRAIFRREIKVMNDPAKPFNLCIVDSDTTSLTDALGITPERVQELGDASEDALTKTGDTVKAMNVIAPMCKHVNEYFFCANVVIHAAERRRSPLHGLLGAILMGPSNPDSDK